MSYFKVSYKEARTIRTMLVLAENITESFLVASAQLWELGHIDFHILSTVPVRLKDGKHND